MYRILLSTDSRPGYRYQNRELDLELFARIVSGEWVEAEQAIQDTISIETIYYTGVWNPDAGQYINNLSQDQVVAAFESWSREMYP